MRSMIAFGKKLFLSTVVQECMLPRLFPQWRRANKLKSKVLSFMLFLTFFRHCLGEVTCWAACTVGLTARGRAVSKHCWFPEVNNYLFCLVDIKRWLLTPQHFSRSFISSLHDISSLLLMSPSTAMSSLKLMIWLPGCLATKLRVNSENNRGLRTWPRGTPVARVTICEVWSWILTACGLFFRKSKLRCLVLKQNACYAVSFNKKCWKIYKIKVKQPQQQQWILS